MLDFELYNIVFPNSYIYIIYIVYNSVEFIQADFKNELINFLEHKKLKPSLDFWKTYIINFTADDNLRGKSKYILYDWNNWGNWCYR